MTTTLGQSRLPFHDYLLILAKVAALRGTCEKRQVGAVVASVNKQIVSVSYNGPPSGLPHCIDSPCKAMTLSAPESHLACRSVHAEVNALLNAGHTARGGIIAVTTSPCYECAKVIVAAGVKTLIIGEVNRLFDDTTTYTETPRRLLMSAGVAIIERTLFIEDLL